MRVWAFIAAGIVSGPFAFFPAVSIAQTSSQITPPTFAPNLERGGGLIIPGGVGLAAPADAEKLFVKLSGVSIGGGLPAPAPATAELEAKLMGRTVSGAEIFAAARELEAAYAKAGYVLVRVILPPQKLVNGSRLTLTVVDGFIERIELKDVPEHVRGRLTHLLTPLTGQRGLTLTELERRVLLAGDTPGVILRSTLASGIAQGASVLVIEAKYQPVSVVLSADNTLSKALGRTTVGAGVDFNSVLGLGELVYLRANGHPNDDGNGFFERYPTNRSLAAGFVVPLWLDGLTFNTEVTDARTTPQTTAVVQTTDTFQRLSVRLRYAWLRGRAANFSSELAFDAQDELQSLFVANVAVPLSLDRLRIARFTNEGDLLTPWGATISGRVTGSFGIDGLGARTAADATVLLPLSRRGADAAFQKLDATFSYSQSVVEHVSVYLAARAQTSFNQPLARSEQIGIANTSGVSAFDAGTVVGDRGYVVRGEVSSPWVLPLAAGGLSMVAAPYVFGAYGEVVLENPTALEASHVFATSYGGGVRFGGQRPGTLSNGSLALEYGRARRSDGGVAGDRFTVVSAFRF